MGEHFNTRKTPAVMGDLLYILISISLDFEAGLYGIDDSNGENNTL